MGNGNLHGAHVGREEVLQELGTLSGQAIEGVAHGLAIRIETVAKTAIGSSIGAGTLRCLYNLEEIRG